MIKKEDVYHIGKITKKHALKGEVVFNFTDDIFDRADCDYLICEIEGILVPFFIEEYRFRSDNSVLVKFENMDTAESVQPLIGSEVYFEKKFATDSEDGEVSLSYFIGFDIQDTDETSAGKIVGIDDTTDNWLFIVENAKGEQALVPANEELIVEINNETSTITMNLPIGILEL
ncbi:MAG: ribosome maturation factor RimM [Bacteroides sp.]|nr:ribosome maturation factor RimM [Roseburia sp.]MCM1346220.1 ribosome maturation factor RimM [Bacteroides sp.]MCM1420697.1 ribosome maturation factor RimM [Bacteroides sp.]